MNEKVIVVGGGLAGLMATIKMAEAGADVELFSIVPVKRSHSVCAQGGINGAVNTKGEGDSPWEHFDDTDLRRRLPGQPAARQGDVRSGAGHHLPAGPHGRHVQPHAGRAPRLPPLRRHQAPPHGLRRRDHGPAVALRAGRAGAPLGGRRASSRSTRTGSSSSAVLDDDGVCRGIVAQDMRSMEIRAFRARCRDPGDRRPGHDLRHDRPTRSSTPARRPAPSISRARATPTASSSRSTRRPSPARTSCG